MFSDISHVRLTLGASKKKLLSTKPGQNALGRPLNIVLSSDKAGEWCRQLQMHEFPKKFKPFGLEPPVSN
jgi:hypothetical protein